jgi:kynurenine formamidase
MFRFRGKSVYLFGYPRIAESVPDFLRQQLLHLKLFGTDTLSISNPSYREQGRECHRRFLCIDPPIVIMEDMDLSSDCLARGTWRLRVYPLILDALDAVPVVALAESASSKVMKEYK